MSKFFFYSLLLFLPVQLGRHFWPEEAFVWGIRIDYLAPTVYLTDIVILLLIGAWIWEKIQSTPGVSQIRHLGSFKKLKKFWPGFLIALFLLVNCLLAKNQWVAFYKLIKIIEFGALAWYVGVVRKIGGIRKKIIGFLAVSVCYSSVIAIIQFLKQGSIGGIVWWLGERTFTSATPGIAQISFFGRLFLRPYATFPHPNVLGGFLALTLPIIIFQILNRHPDPALVGEGSHRGSLNLTGLFHLYQLDRDCIDRIKIIFYSLTFLLGLIALFLTFSRSAILAFLITMTFLILRSYTRPQGLTLGVRALPRGLSVAFILFLAASFLLLTVNIQSPESFTYREQLNKIAFKMIAKNPIFGVGLNNFIPAMTGYATPGVSIRFLQPVHNIYLLMVAELGIPGLILFMWLIIKTLKGVRSQELEVRKGKSSFYLLAPIFLILFLGFFDHYWLTLQQGQIILAIVIGFSLKQKNTI